MRHVLCWHVHEMKAVRGQHRAGQTSHVISHLTLPPSLSPFSQLQCVHFSSWDSNKDWAIPLPSKESVTALSLGSGWIAVATNKQMLRVFSLGGMQRDVISIPGVIVGVAGWGSRLAVIYQEAPCKGTKIC